MSGTWTVDARCLTVGFEVFFPRGQGGAYTSAAKEAKSVCAHCPVRNPCLETALQLEDNVEYIRRAGIWGGLTPRERHALAKQRGQA